MKWAPPCIRECALQAARKVRAFYPGHGLAISKHEGAPTWKEWRIDIWTKRSERTVNDPTGDRLGENVSLLFLHSKKWARRKQKVICNQWVSSGKCPRRHACGCDSTKEKEAEQQETKNVNPFLRHANPTMLKIDRRTSSDTERKHTGNTLERLRNRFA